MKSNNTLRIFTSTLALMAATPSAHAERITDAQRACVQRVLRNPAADIDAVRQCLSAQAAGDPNTAKTLAPDSLEAKALFVILGDRFRNSSSVRPQGVYLTDVRKALEARPDLLFSLNEMEKTGGKPDVIAVKGDTFVFADVSAESPEGRRNLDYDAAKAMADKMRVEMMDEATYRELQKKIRLDAETWSWLLTDAKTRSSGYAMHGGLHDNDVNVLRDSADRRRQNRGFRGLLRLPKS